jgi:hypothetical protein
MTSGFQLRVRAALRDMKTLKRRPHILRAPSRVRFSPLPALGAMTERRLKN